MTPMGQSPPDALTCAVPAGLAELLTDWPTDAQIEALAGAVLSAEGMGGGVHVNTRMHLAHLLAARSVVIPAGTVLVGLPHKLGGLAFCVGDITVWSAGSRERLTGAHLLTTQPGGYRVGFAHTETTWITVHANTTGGDDIACIEHSLVEGAHRLMTRRQLQEASQ